MTGAQHSPADITTAFIAGFLAGIAVAYFIVRIVLTVVRRARRMWYGGETRR